MKITFDLTMPRIEKKMNEILEYKGIKWNALTKFLLICFLKDLENREDWVINDILNNCMDVSNAGNTDKLKLLDLFNCVYPGTFDSEIFKYGQKEKKIDGLLPVFKVPK